MGRGATLRSSTDWTTHVCHAPAEGSPFSEAEVVVSLSEPLHAAMTPHTTSTLSAAAIRLLITSPFVATLATYGSRRKGGVSALLRRSNGLLGRLTPMPGRVTRLVLALTCLAAVLGACGSGDKKVATGPDTTLA